MEGKLPFMSIWNFQLVKFVHVQFSYSFVDLGTVVGKMSELMLISLLFDLKFHLFFLQNITEFIPSDIFLLLLHLFESDIMMKDS